MLLSPLQEKVLSSFSNDVKLACLKRKRPQLIQRRVHRNITVLLNSTSQIVKQGNVFLLSNKLDEVAKYNCNVLAAMKKTFIGDLAGFIFKVFGKLFIMCQKVNYCCQRLLPLMQQLTLEQQQDPHASLFSEFGVSFKCSVKPNGDKTTIQFPFHHPLIKCLQESLPYILQLVHKEHCESAQGSRQYKRVIDGNLCQL